MHVRARIYPFIILAVAVLVLASAWVGWLDSDDKNHMVGAYGWLNEMPFLATDHAALRHTIAVPVGMSMRLFGVSELSLIIPNLIQYFGMILISWSFLRRYLDEEVALLACLLIVTVPLFPIFASVLFTETTELFYLSLSFWLFHEATLRQRKLLLLFSAGMCAGFGWLTRETTAALLLLYGVLFLLGFGIPRKYYWVMAAGFLLVAGAEALYMAVLAGDPWYRYEVILGKQMIIPYKGALEGDVFNRIGNVSINPVIDPFLVLFINHEFALLFYAAIPAVFWCWRAPGLAAQQRTTLRLLIGWAVLWFLFVSFVLTNLHARYYTVCAYVAAILVATWLVHGLRRDRRKISMWVLVILFTANFAAIYVDNPNQLFGERSLVQFLKSSDEDIYTDPVTLRRARFFLSNAGLENRVHDDSLPPNALFFYNPTRLREMQKKNQDTSGYQPTKSWQLFWENSEERKLSGLVIEWIGLKDAMPDSLYRRLNMPNRPVAVYRLPASAVQAQGSHQERFR